MVRVKTGVKRLFSTIKEKEDVCEDDWMTSNFNFEEEQNEWIEPPLEQETMDKPKLLVMRGDPTDWSTDAIVTDTNSLLNQNCGLREKIISKGGLSIQNQSNEWVYFQGEVPVGSAIWTTSGRLSSKVIIHTVGPNITNYRWPTPHHQFALRRAVRSALNVANSLHLTSVAIPALCTGLNRYPKYMAAREIVNECLAFCDTCPVTSLRLIVFMNEDEVTTSMFVQAMKDARQQRKMSVVTMTNETIETYGSFLDGSSEDYSPCNSDDLEIE
ncbi:Uncharacterized protein P3T76_011888 [Phytophthora citrophthora]|uniref:Macro domain-containing protein n=1 Tax=Phytophthora citrophthora TaxID=4793 RepID=A0AAD9G8F4_9STRA|nr:Uncharacterized protein P3T76_011888 [Phytophthora citrophthora]